MPRYLIKKIRCDECNGSGKIYSHIDADKDKVCEACKGTGLVKKNKLERKNK